MSPAERGVSRLWRDRSDCGEKRNAEIGFSTTSSSRFVLDGSRSGQRFEHLLAGSAHGAAPLFRKILELGSLGHLAPAVAAVGVIEAAAVDGLTLMDVLGFGHGITSRRLRF